MTMIRTSPCNACPYRKDAPSGVWAEHEYEKLRAYDNGTGEQPIAPFSCHATPEQHCHGWAVVHSRRGHEHDLLAFRVWPPENDPAMDEAVPLWESGNAAADHGVRDIDNPSPEAIARVQRLMQKHERLR